MTERSRQPGSFPALEEEVWLSRFRARLRVLRPDLSDQRVQRIADQAWPNGRLLQPADVAEMVAPAIV